MTRVALGKWSGVVAFACLLLALSAQSSEAFAGPWAPGVEASLPANAASNPSVNIVTVSCASAGSCTAVGTYEDSSGHQEGLLLTESSGKWSTGVEATLPGNAAANPLVALGSVSCASAGNCAAVGTYTDSSGNPRGVLLTESSGTWSTGVQAILPGAVPSPSVPLESVSCASAGDCTAVGSYEDSSGDEHGVLWTESAGIWSTGVEPTLPANAAPNGEVELTSVSCASAGNCTAVGQYADSSFHGQGLLLSESSGTWSTGVEATLPAGAVSGPGVELSSVSCASAGNCTAVGIYAAGSVNPQGLLVTESAGRWSTGVQATLPAGAETSSQLFLEQVSCGSAGNCTAVGEHHEFPNAFLLNESSGTWATGVQPTAADAAPGTVGLSSVSCATAGNCAAVGSYFDSASRSPQGLLLSETSGTWDAGAEATLPAGAGSSPDVDLASVSCASAGNCAAVGTYTDGSGNGQGLLLTESVRPELSALGASPRRLALAGREVGSHCVRQTSNNENHTRCRRPIKLEISYTLNTPATVVFTFQRQVPGRRVRLISVRGKIVRSANVGANRFAFVGMIGGHELGPGTYRLTATPSAAGNAGPNESAKFTLVG